MYGIFLVPYYSREPRRASRVRGSLFYITRCSRLWRVSVFVNASRAVPGADTRAGFLRLPESGRPRQTPASFPGPVCRQCPEPMRAPGFFFCLNPAARAEPRRPFRAPFAANAPLRIHMCLYSVFDNNCMHRTHFYTAAAGYAVFLIDNSYSPFPNRTHRKPSLISIALPYQKYMKHTVTKSQKR